MKSGKDPRPTGNSASRLRGGLGALLRKVGGTVRERVRTWLGRAQPEATPAVLPVTSISTRKMLQANRLLAGWHGTVNVLHPTLDLDGMPGRYLAEPSLAAFFSHGVADRHRPAELPPFALGLPLRPLPLPTASSSTTGKTQMPKPARAPLLTSRRKLPTIEDASSLSPEVHPASTEMSKPSAAATPLAQSTPPQPVRRSVRRILKPLTEPRLTTQSARRPQVLQALMRKPQPLPGQRQPVSQSLLRAQRQPLARPVGLDRQLVVGKTPTPAPSIAMADRFRAVEDGTPMEKVGVLTSREPILSLSPRFEKARRSAVPARQRAPRQSAERWQVQPQPIHRRHKAPLRSVEREAGSIGPVIGPNLASALDVQRVPAKTASARRAPMTVSIPGSRDLARRSPPLTRSVRQEDVRLHPVKLGWRFKPQIGSSLKYTRLLPKVSVPLARETDPGKPLAPGPRKIMERLLGDDFGDVRVHSEPAVARMAADLKAEAFVVGRDIFFGTGKAKFNTVSGMALLGHELTHVAHRRSIRRQASSSLLQAQAEEQDALGKELAVKQVLQHRPGALGPWPLSLTLNSAGSGKRESVTTGALSVQVPASIGRDAPSTELATARVERPTTTEAPASAAPAPVAEAEAPERRERELEVQDLARQVYDMIMRRLALERERVGYR